MTDNLISVIVLISPVAFAATAIASWFQPGIRPSFVKQLSTVSALLNIIIVFWCGLQVFNYGLVESGLIGYKEIGISIRLDSLSITMLGLIALLGFIIIKFSANYLDGDQRQGAFMGRLAATVASVQLLVISGNLGLLFLAWILTSISLHRLLVFYPERSGAQIAARKKFILARLGDACLLAAILMLYLQFGSGNLEFIFDAIRSGTSQGLSALSLEGPALLLVAAALLKSAQFPTHGWLIEVMETPTPVSALLHAGLLNAGPFLIIRMAYVMDMSGIAPIVLMVVGGFTALFASVAYLTQTSIKTALGYSSVAHMGFSLMVCGLGAYPAAMLHLVAHSFYKAHAFLSSGSVIDLVRSSKIVSKKTVVYPWQILAGMLIAFMLYAGFAMIWGVNPTTEFSLLAIGAIIILGLTRIFSVALSENDSRLIIKASLLALVVTVAFYVFESGARILLADQLPPMDFPGVGKLITLGVLLLIFAAAVYGQLIVPRFSSNHTIQRFAIHLRNGFYANAIFDRLIGSIKIRTADPAQIHNERVLQAGQSDYEEFEKLNEQLA